MTRNSCTPTHKMAQGILKEVLSNLPLPPGWVCQHVETEYLYEGYGKSYKIDVHGQWRYKGEKYELFVEIQKNKNDKEFIEKSKYFTGINLMDSKKIFIVLWEKNIPSDSMEMWSWFKENIQTPW